MTSPILMLGAGNMGGAMVRGWLAAKAFAASDLAFFDPRPGKDARAAITAGATHDPADLAVYPTFVLAVKPQLWRAASAEIIPRLAPDAVVVSVVAGVQLAELEGAFGGRRIARTVPTTGVATGQGVCAVYAADSGARARAHALFDPVAATVDLAEEGQLDGATAVSGSAPAYLYAMIEALEAAGTETGLPAEAARTLARATMASASILLRETGEDPAELRRQVTSPNGVTEAALKVLMAEETGFPRLMREAVAAAVRRSRELGAPSA